MDSEKARRVADIITKARQSFGQPLTREEYERLHEMLMTGQDKKTIYKIK